jgi:valyl-tRNA synthetase
MSSDLPKAYDPASVQAQAMSAWTDERLFHAEPTDPGKPYSVVIPPPNVTAALHLGHALNNTLQDILIRWHRMLGDNTCWLPGTDHAGIATQTVVEKRVLAEQGKRRTEFGRDEFVGIIQAWKDEYEQRITEQLKAMGCSCDWDRQAFTMDEPRARAVREAFFRLFKDGLIYRGKRLVNWDPATQTALADDEVEMEEIDGHFYYLKYPLDEGTEARRHGGTKVAGYVTVATTRPETMLGDTAVAINPKDPRAAALRGRLVRLPIVNRIVPIIEDDYVVLPDAQSDDAKAKYATGFLKVTPAHDPNDYEIGQRHKLPLINVLAPDATISDQHGWPKEDFDKGGEDLQNLLGMDRFEARRAVVEWFKRNGLLEDVKPYRHSVGHSYRSHVPIEPYLSDQWYCKVTDDRLAGAALRAMAPDQRERALPLPPGGEGRGEAKSARSANRAVSPQHPAPLTPALSPPGRGGKTWEGQLRFYPPRYARTFQTWHENLRDWCISRQLWWGHRIPVWTFSCAKNLSSDSPGSAEQQILNALKELRTAIASYFDAAGAQEEYAFYPLSWKDYEVRVCTKSDRADRALKSFIDFHRDWGMHEWQPGTPRRVASLPRELSDALAAASTLANLASALSQDPDVLDTWFSSALWPMSTMGWPDESSISDLNSALNTWNPTSVLCTAREIITLWVSRMTMFNIYFLDRLPFTDVFIHAMIQDGEGRKMSKSLGNGVDPLDIIATHGADALRFTLASMATNTQDVRLPVETDPATGHNSSPKFDLGRNFCNKLWNAARFAISNLESVGATPASPPGGVEPEAMQASPLHDRWILSRLATTIRDVNDALADYRFDQYAKACYDFFWRDLCDWYIEAIKPAMRDPKQSAHVSDVLAVALDVSLRLLHPVIPFITETIWWRLCEVRPERGIPGMVMDCAGKRLITAAWPRVDAALIDADAESTFAQLQELTGVIRNIRNDHKVEPRRVVTVAIAAPADIAAAIIQNKAMVETLAGCTIRDAGPDARPAANAARGMAGGVEVHVEGLVDPQAEKQRNEKRREELIRQVSAMKGRLANENYAKKAPPHLVQQTRDQLAEAEAELARLGESA